jgi:hypothetical protein
LIRLPNDYRQLTEPLTLGMPLVGSANNVLLGRYRDLAAWLAADASGPIDRRGARVAAKELV